MSFEYRSVRIVDLQAIAQSQWSIWVKDESQDLPDFEPGQFCMLSFENLVDPLLPRPYAIVERKNGLYRFIYRVDGKFTKLLSRMWRGASLKLLGPLGKPSLSLHSSLRLHTKAVFVAGGVGYSSLYSLMKASKAEENILFYGLRTELDRIPINLSLKIYYSTDDGSLGFKGRIHELLLQESELWKDAEVFYICGPTPMMKAVYSVLPPEKSFYFLEESMGCGFGICMGCVVPTEGSEFPKRSCIEGPVFRGDDLKRWMQT